MAQVSRSAHVVSKRRKKGSGKTKKKGKKAKAKVNAKGNDSGEIVSAKRTSMLPTVESMRNNEVKLQFYVEKEMQRNLATLMSEPEKRAKSKKLKNLSRHGFEVHVNRRYRLADGRVGVCKFR